MKAVIAFLLVLGSFSLFASYNIWSTESFRVGYQQATTAVSASSHPQEFKASVIISAGLGLGCYIAALVIYRRSKSRN